MACAGWVAAQACAGANVGIGVGAAVPWVGADAVDVVLMQPSALRADARAGARRQGGGCCFVKACAGFLLHEPDARGAR